MCSWAHLGANGVAVALQSKALHLLHHFSFGARNLDIVLPQDLSELTLQPQFSA